MILQVSPGGVGVPGIAPFDLPESGQRTTQVREIKIPLGVMMGQVPHLLPFRCGFDCRKSGVGKLPDVPPTPLRCLCKRADSH
jgi:hypothetical protein